ncbi:hypothetical protein BEN30_07425 [Magnetovibrio blakemorei]|uniref:Uncharacterized protein n=2 Tax=Magnetovibrio blakemorei TaxID=28181 RepID=A0A1E5Q9A1_9PROT|nr:hypothetical protein BEN30_07425 [Magnetovibrio blakemorei]
MRIVDGSSGLGPWASRLTLWVAGVVCVLALSLPSGVRADTVSSEAGYWRGVATEVSAVFDEMIEAVRRGDDKAAKRSQTRAYFGVFEDRKMEAAIRKTFGQARAYEIESGFSQVRRLIGKGSTDEIQDARDALVGLIEHDAVALDQAGVSKDVYDVR